MSRLKKCFVYPRVCKLSGISHAFTLIVFLVTCVAIINVDYRTLSNPVRGFLVYVVASPPYRQ